MPDGREKNLVDTMLGSAPMLDSKGPGVFVTALPQSVLCEKKILAWWQCFHRSFYVDSSTTATESSQF